ncbi:Hypothetical predicted protein [Cloeon dipterum]|uniref:Uncharacterized protein n=2 Tax=Cloeon dipterum TaxID=197152 RepID=A0A8S1CK01_9INSE|nr:Hypothetical predicted protein [Cloeon dipterum]
MSDFSPPRKTRRSSILKGSRAPLQNLEDNEGFDEDRTTVTKTAFKRRVSFSSTNNVQEFCNDVDEVWGERYEKPMMLSDAKSQSDLVNLQSTKSFESLMTGQIKSLLEMQAPLATHDDQEDEMELTSTGMPTFSQESQASQAAVTIIERNAPYAVDKENLTHASVPLMNKTILSSANMSMDGHSLTEDASYPNSPGFNKTHLNLSDVDDSDESDGVTGILNSAKQTASARAMNKTAHESICMDITSVSRLSRVHDGEVKTEDQNAAYPSISDFSDHTNEMKGDGSESSTDTLDLVMPGEAMFSFSKSRKSLCLASNSDVQMDITNVNNASSTSMEMTMAPRNSSSSQMDITMAPKKSFISSNDSACESANNKTLIHPLEMSFDEEQPDVEKQPAKISDHTICHPVDVSVEDSIGNWNQAVVKNNSTLNIPSNNVTRSISLESEEENLPNNLISIPEVKVSTFETKQDADLSSEEILAKPLTPDTSIVMDETSRASFLNKTFDVHASRVLAASLMDCTSNSVPDESLMSDSVFRRTENCTDTNKVGSQLTNNDPSEMVGESAIAEGNTPAAYNKAPISTSNHAVYASLKRSYMSSCDSPESVPSRRIALSDDQELNISPNKAMVVTRPSPEKPNSNGKSEAGPSHTLRSSPICRSYNALSIEKTQARSFIVGDRNVAGSQMKRELQKSRRQPGDHSPVKKICVSRGLDMSASKLNDCSRTKSNVSSGNLDSSRRVDFDASTSRMVNDASSFMKRSDMDVSKRSEFDASKLSISFIRPEMQRKPPLLMASFDEFERMLAEKKTNTKLAELNAKMDAILKWHSDRKASMETKEATQTQTDAAAVQDDVMEVDVQPADQDAALTPLASKLKEMCKKVERCWRFVSDDVCGIELSILNNTMKMELAMDSSDVVRKISLAPTETTFPWQRFVHDLFLKRVNAEELTQECKSKNEIPKLLKDLHPKLVKFTHLMITLEKASKRNVLSYQGTRIHFRCYSLKLAVAIEVSVDVAKWDKIVDTDVKAWTFVGSLQLQEIPSLVAYERKNENFLPKYIKTVEEFIATKEKFA